MIRALIAIIMLGLATCGAFAVGPCEPPPDTVRSGDFGFGEQQVVFWEAVTACPFTHWYRQYSIDNGTNWLYPELLGTTSGTISNGVFRPQNTHWFLLPADVTIITRAIPVTPPPPPPPVGGSYVLTYPDGGQSVVIDAEALPERQKKPKKNR